MADLTRSEAWELLTKYNKEPFHLRHALTVEGIMKYFAKELAMPTKQTSGLRSACCMIWILKVYPAEHCLNHRNHARTRTGRKIDPRYRQPRLRPGAKRYRTAAPDGKGAVRYRRAFGTDRRRCIMRPSKSVMDLELKSVKKKYKDKKFAAGCSRDVIEKALPTWAGPSTS